MAPSFITSLARNFCRTLYREKRVTERETYQKRKRKRDSERDKKKHKDKERLFLLLLPNFMEQSPF
jgi:hypothetical protein